MMLDVPDWGWDLHLDFAMVTGIYTPLIQIFALFLDFEGAKIIHIL